MQGTFRRRVFPAVDRTRTITITGTGNTSNCYVTINGTKVTAAGTYSVTKGDTITCHVGAVFSSSNKITLNGTTVASGRSADYDYSVMQNITIALSGSAMGANTIAITEG